MSNDHFIPHASSLSMPENILLSRFRQILLTTLAATLLGMANFLFFVAGMPDEQFYRGVSVFLFLLSGVISSLVLVRCNRYQLAISLFLWSITLCLIYMHWLSGGLLKDPIVTLYPCVLVLAALIGKTRNFLMIFILVISALVYISILDSQGLNSNIALPLSYSHIVDACLIMIVSGALAWQISRDYKQLLNRLFRENKRHRESRETFNYHAHHDPLTGLYNRTGLQGRFQELVSQADVSARKVLILFLDLDDFKAINDAYDHSAGDQVLHTLAQRLNRLGGTEDIISRVSGDEFIIAAPRDQLFQAGTLAESVLQSVTQPIFLQGADRTITASIGMSVFPDDGLSLESLHKKADLAMYKAKHAGKNNYYQYDETLNQENNRKTSITDGLREALDNGGLSLHFHPRVNIKTGQVQAVEALLRWEGNNPDGFMPEEFIPVIDSTDLIVSIGHWVFVEACLSCKKWQDAGFPDIRVSVNISYIQLAGHDLPRVITDALKAADLAPGFLEVELREELLTSNDDNLLAELRKLKELGVTLSVDDFGTGYSSLPYLTRFQVDRLKFDRPFIHKLNKSHENRAIVMAMIKMARILGLKSTAEGVETVEELNTLKFLGCEDGQGYLWGQPLSLAELIRELENNSYARYALNNPVDLAISPSFINDKPVLSGAMGGVGS